VLKRLHQRARATGHPPAARVYARPKIRIEQVPRESVFPSHLVGNSGADSICENDSGNGKEIYRGDCLAMISKKGKPALA
jgi:hypothetical protein